MLLFDNLPALQRQLGSAAKWQRLAEAVAKADRVLPEVSYSVADSLTYRVTGSPDRDVLTAQRRYLAVRYVLDGEAEIEVARVGSLQPLGEYSDLSDRQAFAGSGTRHVLTGGQVAVIEPGEAVADRRVDGRVMVLRVTVEGAPPGGP